MPHRGPFPAADVFCPGAARAIAILREEMDRTLGLLGVPAVPDFGPDVLTR